MVFTSVSGHLMELEFGQQHRTWKSVPPAELYQVPVYKQVPQVHTKRLDVDDSSLARSCPHVQMYLGQQHRTWNSEPQPSCTNCLCTSRFPRCALQGISSA